MDDSEKLKFKALSDIASIDVSLEFDIILQNILKITCETMNAHSGTIMLVNENDDELKMVASYKLSNDYIERVYEAAKKWGVSLTSSPSGIVLETGKYYIVPDIIKEPRDKPWYDLSKELGFSSQIFTPMKIMSKIIGLLNVYMTEPHQFTDNEIEFMTIAAFQAASVVQNARMCSRLKNNIQELKQCKEHLEENIKEAHKKLYDSEEYLQIVLKSSLDGIAVIDDNGRFEFGNDSFFDILGWTRDELIGQYFMKVIPDDTKQFALEHWQGVQYDLGGPHEIKIKTRSDEIKYIHVTSSLAEIRGKKKVIASIKDISEKKKLESDLQISEARYRDFFENADDPMFTLDTKGRLLALNNSGIKMLGWTKDELTVTHISRWLTPESFKIVQDVIKKHIQGENIESPVILELICKNKEYKCVEVKSRFLEKDGRIIGIHWIARDITEKKRLEQKLKEYHEQLEKSSEELKETGARYRDLFEDANDGIYTATVDGYFTNVNYAVLMILGCTSKDEVIGTHISRWFTSESLQIADEIIRKCISDESLEQPITLEVVRKDGEHRWVDFKNRIIKEGNNIIGIHGIGRDITEKRTMERELLQADKLATIGQLAAGIAHEINNPLGNISLYSQLLLKKAEDENTKAKLLTISDEADRAAQIVKGLLDFSRESEPRLSFVDLNMEISKVLSILNLQLKDLSVLDPKQMDISITTDLGFFTPILADGGQIRQVIMNILTNSVQSINKDGKIIIKTKGKDGYVEISISDNGCGIPPNNMYKIFDPFFTTKEPGRGTGLGLSICYGVVKRHKGSIDVKSEVGKGTTVTVKLPVRYL